MKTLVTTSPEVAAAFIRSGEIAAFPTETVYGLGAHAFTGDAVRKIFDAKGRPSDNPLIVHIFDTIQLDSIVTDVPPYAQRLIEHFFPGPLTLVLRKSRGVPGIVTAGLDTVGVRMPDHPLAHAFLKACGSPVAAPSANRSGRPSPTSWQAVLEDLDGLVPCVLRGERAAVGLESTVVNCTDDAPVVLRTGAVDLSELQRVVNTARMGDSADGGTIRSPGLLHRHYAPRARVIVVGAPPSDPPPRSAYIGMTAPPLPAVFDRTRVCGNVDEYAYELFDFFRACDRASIRTIYCERPAPEGLGTALADRLQRASESDA